MKKSLILALVFAFAAVLRADTVVEEIIARVNDQIITRSELNRERDALKKEIAQGGGPNVDPSKAADAEKNLLRDLIDKQLLVDKAKELGISGDTELIKRLDEMRKQMHLETMEDLEKEAEKQGVSYEDFKQNMRENIQTQEVISREVGSRLQITKAEEEQFYNDHKKELEQPESVRLSEILISTQKPSAEPGGEAVEDPAKVAPAEAKAKEVLAQLKGGAKFEEVAKKNSEGPTAQDGGDLGYFGRGQLAKELEDLTFKMKAGDISDVIRTRQGFVILKVTEHRPAGIPPLKDVESQVQEGVYVKKLQPALREYLTKLREDAFIDIKPGFIDTGASPNQTKPTYTTGSASDLASKTKSAKKKHKKLGVF